VIEAASLPRHPSRKPHHLFATMGTVVTVDVRTDLPEEDLRAALDRAFGWLAWVDETFSTYKAASEISRLQRGELSLADCHPEVRGVLAACETLKEETEGFFDVRAGADRALDPSGLVKGWAAERASAMLSAAGVLNHALNAAGDIALAGEPEPGGRWRIGIAHPVEPRALSTVVAVGAGGVATSGISERGPHVFDPHTGQPATDLASVTVIGPSLATADAYATAALAMGVDGPVWLSGLEGYESYVIDAGGHIWCSAGFPAYQVM
jgi:thiamine biosynthesis lipoprotein